jgi:hypothetical protein
MVSIVACTSDPYVKDREELAKLLGVDLSDYRISDFPISYFSSVIQPGTAIESVHEIITGYSKVYSCGNYKEIYNYFDIEDSKAFRFMVLFDSETLTYTKMEGEDPDSRTIIMEDCNEGLLHK